MRPSSYGKCLLMDRSWGSSTDGFRRLHTPDQNVIRRERLLLAYASIPRETSI